MSLKTTRALPVAALLMAGTALATQASELFLRFELPADGSA